MAPGPQLMASSRTRTSLDWSRSPRNSCPSGTAELPGVDASTLQTNITITDLKINPVLLLQHLFRGTEK